MMADKNKRMLVSAFLCSLFCLAGIAALVKANRNEPAPLLFLREEAAASEVSPAPGENGAAPADTSGLGSESKDSPGPPSEPAEFPVYLTGAVEREGIYMVKEGCFLFELIDEAGGFAEHAAACGVNLAAEVEGNAHIHIPTREEWESGELMPVSLPAPAAAMETRRVDINKASAEELMSLPGIGEKTALDIIAYREENGAFGSAEELMQVPGIKEARFSKLKDYIKAGR